MTAKEAVQEVLNQAPSDATYEDIMYRIYLREKIERGLKDIEQGNLVPTEEVEARLSRYIIAVEHGAQLLDVEELKDKLK